MFLIGGAGLGGASGACWVTEREGKGLVYRSTVEFGVSSAPLAGWFLSPTNKWAESYFDPDERHSVGRKLLACRRPFSAVTGLTSGLLWTIVSARHCVRREEARMIALRTPSRWIASLFVVLAINTGAQATTIDIGMITASVSGPGTVTGSLGPAGLDVSASGNYSFNFIFENTTGTAGSPVNALPFLDVFIGLEVGANAASCGGVATLPGGSSFNCSAAFDLGTGHHIVTALLDLTLAQNPLPLTDGSTFEAQDASAGGEPTPLKKNSGGMSTASKAAIIVAVAGGGAGGAIAAIGGKKQPVPVTEPGTLLLGTGVAALAYARVRWWRARPRRTCSRAARTRQRRALPHREAL
jgi:hypothetical protein